MSAARTPIGKIQFISARVRNKLFSLREGNFNGSLSKLPASDLGAVVIKEVLSRGSTDLSAVNEVILGQALTAGTGQNPARQAAWKAGIPKETPAYLCNMLCGSGLKAVSNGYQAIRSGEASVVVCGGQESMTQAPHAVHMRTGTKLGPATLVDTMINDGLTDAFTDIHMGITGENIARKYGVTREKEDAYAARSQQRAEHAQKNGFFDDEIVAVPIVSRTGTTLFAVDEFPRHGTTEESLAKLKPCFEKNGTVTPGNASGLNDSAAAVLLMSAEEVKARAVQPLARIVAFGQTGVEPELMGIGAAAATEVVVSKSGCPKLSSGVNRNGIFSCSLRKPAGAWRKSICLS